MTAAACQVVLGGVVRASELGEVSDVTWSTRFGAQPGDLTGCGPASWSMDLPDQSNGAPSILTLGRKVEIFCNGDRVHLGVIAEVETGTTWTIHTTGAPSVAEDYQATTGTATPTLVPDTAVDQAIGRGLPWTRPTSIGTSAVPGPPAFGASVKAVLDAWSLQGSTTRWAVWADGVLTTAAPPTAPKWALVTSAPLQGVADDNYYTDLVGRYLTATTPTYGYVRSTNAAALAKFSRREGATDLAAQGVITNAAAQAAVDARLALVAPRVGLTEKIVASTDHLRHVAGAPGELAAVRAGDMVRVLGSLDVAGSVQPAAAIDVVLGEVEYTAGADTIVLTPLGLAPRDFAAILGAGVTTEGTEVG